MHNFLGPRGAMIFYRKGVRSVTKKGEEVMYDIEAKINFSGWCNSHYFLLTFASMLCLITFFKAITSVFLILLIISM